MSRIRHFRQLALGITAPIVLAFALVPSADAAVAEYTIDAQRTVVSFETRSLGLFSYHGRFGTTSGKVQLDPQAGAGSVDIVVDARSLSGNSRAVEQFMRGPGLLDVERFPRIVYAAQRIEFAGGTPDRIVGALTLLGVTRPVTLAIAYNDCLQRGAAATRCTMIATATFRRSDFGMTAWRALASDEVKLVVDATGVLVPM